MAGSARVRVDCGRGVVLEVTSDSVKDLVKVLAQYQEVLTSENCGCCNSERTALSHRTDKDGHDYYSVVCLECNAQLAFGQHKTGGTLFRKRQNRDGVYDKEHRGWFHWTARSEGSSEGRQTYSEPESFDNF